MVNFNPHRILQKDLTKTRRWRDHAMKRARFREFIFIFQAAIRYSSEGTFIFNRVIDGYCARGSMTAPNISMKTRWKREKSSRRIGDREKSCYPWNRFKWCLELGQWWRPRALDAFDEIPRVVFFPPCLPCRIPRVVSDEISATNFMEIPDINSNTYRALVTSCWHDM